MRSLPLIAFVLALAAACEPARTQSVAEAAQADTSVDNDVPLDPVAAGGAAQPRALVPVPAPASYAPVYADLLALQSPAKSQGGRNLCTVFATTAMMEYLAIATGVDRAPSYSEQWLFWAAQTQFPAQEGVHEDTEYSTGAANFAAAQTGVPKASAWPYEPQYWSANHGHPECTGATEPLPCYTDGDPPAAVKTAPTYAFQGSVSSIATKDIKAWLATHHTPVIASTVVYCQAWNLACGGAGSSADDFRKGLITYPNPGDSTGGAHEFLIVGWDDVTAVPLRDAQGNPLFEDDGVTPRTETGFYIFKNSWTAKGFGSENAYAVGYGLISQRYMTEMSGSATVVNDGALVTPVASD
jgi:hypothetical protein